MSATTNSASEPFTIGTDASITQNTDLNRQAAEAVRAEVEQVKTELDQQQRKFGKRLRNWFALQLDRISNAVVALLAAGIITLVMPFFVKLQMSDEFQTISTRINTLVAKDTVAPLFADTEQLIKDSENLRLQNEDLTLSLSGIQTQLNELPQTIEQVTGATNLQNAVGIVSQQQTELQARLTALQTQISALANAGNRDEVVTTPELSIPKLTDTIERRISDGRRLITAGNEAAQQSWISQVSLLVSLVQLPGGDVTTLQQTMQSVYAEEAPYDSLDAQMQQTMNILITLRSWLVLY